MKKILSYLRKHPRVSFVLVLLCIAVLGYTVILPWQQKRRLVEDIENGRLSYCNSTVGWIDWGHANPSGPDRLVKDIVLHQGDSLIYFQDMKKSFCGVRIIVRLSNTYSIPKELGVEKNGVTRFIFEDVSKDFEDLQSSHPFKPMCGMGVGDINGDRVALARSLHLKMPREILRLNQTEVSLEKFKKGTDLNTISKKLDILLPKAVAVRKCSSRIQYIVEYKK